MAHKRRSPDQTISVQTRVAATSRGFGADAEIELRRQSGIGSSIAAGMVCADPKGVFDGLEADLQQARARIAQTWPASRLSIIQRAKKPWDGIHAQELIGTLKQRAEAQLGLCAAILQGAIEAKEGGNNWHSQAAWFVVSILRLHGAVDALEITRDTLTVPRVKKAAAAKRAGGEKTKSDFRAVAIKIKGKNPHLSRASAAEKKVEQRLCRVGPDHAKRLIYRIFSKDEWRKI